MPPFPVARINQNGGPPHVELAFGNAHVAKYEIWLHKKTPPPPPKRIGFGVNDNVPDIAPLTEPFPILHNSVVRWQAAIADPTGAPGGYYLVTVHVIQDGNIVGMETKTGQLTEAPVTGFIELEVV